MRAKDIFGLLKQTVKEWSEDKAPRLAAAMSYYTIFSLAPFLVIIIAVIGLVFKNAQAQIVNQISGLVGQNGAQMVQTMIQGASKPATGIIAAILSIIILIFGASGLFGELQDALNTIWEVAPRPGRGILATLKDRFFSFVMVLGVGFLLLVSLVLSTALSAINTYMVGLLPGWDLVLQILNIILSFAVITGLFAMIFKILPEAKIAWRDVWLGAAVTALLFTLGKFLIGLYLGRSAVTSTYGAAGSLVVILLWIYYSAQIMFFGAEFTQVYANRFGSHIVPEPGAVELSAAARAEQGIPHKEALERAGRETPQRAAPQQRSAHGLAFTGRSQPGAAEMSPDIPKHRTPAQKSMLALEGVLVTLVGFVSSMVIANRRK